MQPVRHTSPNRGKKRAIANKFTDGNKQSAFGVSALMLRHTQLRQRILHEELWHKQISSKRNFKL